MISSEIPKECPKCGARKVSYVGHVISLLHKFICINCNYKWGKKKKE